MELNWNCQRGAGIQTKNLSWMVYGYFLEQHIFMSQMETLIAIFS